MGGIILRICSRVYVQGGLTPYGGDGTNKQISCQKTGDCQNGSFRRRTAKMAGVAKVVPKKFGMVFAYANIVPKNAQKTFYLA